MQVWKISHLNGLAFLKHMCKFDVHEINRRQIFLVCFDQTSDPQSVPARPSDILLSTKVCPQNDVQSARDERDEPKQI